MTRASSLALLSWIVGCGGAVGTENAPGPGARPGSNETAIDFETDPQSCGRAGRVCDDGVCKNGMCAPRVEAIATTPSAVFDIAVLDGRVWAAIARAENGPVTFPIVRFDGSGPTTVIADNGPWTCIDRLSDCIVADETTVYVTAHEKTKTRVRRFGADGSERSTLEMPGDGFGRSQLYADGGRIVARGLLGGVAIGAEDGVVTPIRVLPQSTMWPVLSGSDVFIADQSAVQRVGFDGSLSRVGAVMGGVAAMAVGPTDILALGHVPDRAPMVFRFPRNDRSDVLPPRGTLLAAEREAIGTATIGVPAETVEQVYERAVQAKGRFYFTWVVRSADRETFARVIVVWSEERGFRPFAPITVPLDDESAVRLEVSNERLYWMEQPTSKDGQHPPWRVMSLPL